jgi:hypothetical protein
VTDASKQAGSKLTFKGFDAALRYEVPNRGSSFTATFRASEPKLGSVQK